MAVSDGHSMSSPADWTRDAFHHIGGRDAPVLGWELFRQKQHDRTADNSPQVLSGER